MSSEAQQKPTRIEVFVTQDDDGSISVMEVLQDETITETDWSLNSRSLIGALREVTASEIEDGYQPTDAWQQLAEAEYRRNFALKAEATAEAIFEAITQS